MPLPLAASVGVVLGVTGALGPRAVDALRRHQLAHGREVLRERGWTPAARAVATAPCALPFDLLLRNTHLSAGVLTDRHVTGPLTVESDVVTRRWELAPDTDRVTALRYLDAGTQEVLADDRFKALNVQVRSG